MKILHDTTSSSNSVKHKERHIVTWSPQEDDILREQISIHGTENWAIIAAQFKDKTTRQCRRRWYTYLNSDFKKGGWTQEEDMILCEAQKIYGNRWTEIAKVVSGRTDNAVKNRFSTLCKKRAKHEALAKENSLSSCIIRNNKRGIIEDAIITNAASESAPPLKKMRSHILDVTENSEFKARLHIKSDNEPRRPPLALLRQNSGNASDLPCPQTFNSTNTDSIDGSTKVQGTYLRRDDPRITALMQQAELLSSLAVKVNTEKSNQSLESAWKELQDFLKRSSESELLSYQISETDFPFEELMNLVEESRDMESVPSWRQPNLYESPESSGYSTGSTLQPHTANEETEQLQADACSLQQQATLGSPSTTFTKNEVVVSADGFIVSSDTNVEPQSITFVPNETGVCADGFIVSSDTNVEPLSVHAEAENGSRGDVWVDGLHTGASVAQEMPLAHMPSCDEAKESEIMSALLNTEFTSPIQATPMFKTFAEAIPSPIFSESERHFLVKTLLGSPAPNPSHNPSQPPPCRRALLHSL